MTRVGKKLGDTLVEVTIAIGIFSMVAVAIVAVVSSGSSGAQSTLENTVAREEIDAQAEALRFIQATALTELGDKGTDSELWQKIASHAVAAKEDNITYNVNDCSADIYGNDNFLSEQKAFIINTRKLSSGNVDEIIVPYDKDKFKPASTYPRIIYSDDNDNSLMGQDTGSNIKSVEGIYIVAVKNKETKIVDAGEVKNKSAYYDFYIRTCWYGAGSNTPTTISTVTRLYNPDVATEGVKPSAVESHHDDVILYSAKSDNGTEGHPKYSKESSREVITGGVVRFGVSNVTDWKGYKFTGYWCTKQQTKAISPTTTISANNVCSGGVAYLAGDSGTTYKVPYGYTADNQQHDGKEYKLYATYRENPTVTVKYDKNGGSGTMDSETGRGGTQYTIRANTFTRTHYDFNGWCKNATTCSSPYANNSNIDLPEDGSPVTLYAQWKKKPSNTITFNCGSGKTKKNANLTQTIYSDDDTTLRNISSMCTAPTNYTFNNWEASNCSSINGDTYGNAAKFPYNSSCTSGITLTAQWKLNSKKLIENGSINNEGFPKTTSFDATPYGSLKASGKASISYKSCHSSSSGWTDGKIDMVIKSGGVEKYRTTLVSKAFSTSDWIEGSVSNDFDITVSLSDNGIVSTEAEVSFVEPGNNVFCHKDWGDWQYYYRKSISDLNVVLYGS